MSSILTGGLAGRWVKAKKKKKRKEIVKRCENRHRKIIQKLVTFWVPVPETSFQAYVSTASVLKIHCFHRCHLLAENIFCILMKCIVQIK